MHLITEIFCKRSLLGEKLPENITFVAACNPYRELTNKQNNLNIGLLYNKTDSIRNQRLTYLVNPLPISLLTFVFDFGNINPEDEKKYIGCMIKNYIHFPEENFEIAQNLIFGSHIYLKKEIEVSSVSLRDIRRFYQIKNFLDYDYVANFLNKFDKYKKIEEENERYKFTNYKTALNQDHGNLFIDSNSEFENIIIALYVWYSLRLGRKDKKKRIFSKFMLSFQKFAFE